MSLSRYYDDGFNKKTDTNKYPGHYVETYDRWRDRMVYPTEEEQEKMTWIILHCAIKSETPCVDLLEELGLL